MKLVNQVTSVKLSNRLLELGVRKESQFYRDWTGAKEDEILMWENTDGDVCLDNVNCYTAAELGEMLPYKITAETINLAHPMPLIGNGTDDEIHAIDEATQKLREVLKDLEHDNLDQFESGMPYDIKRDYDKGTNMRYWQQSDEWECYIVIEISGDTEADCRALMLIYLIENKLVDTKSALDNPTSLRTNTKHGLGLLCL